MGSSTPVVVSRHRCLIYDGDPSELLPIVVPFLSNGIRDNWRCLCLGSPSTNRSIETALATQSIDVAGAVRSGRLILSAERDYLRGAFDPPTMLTFLNSMIDEAVQSGYKGLCATGDMFWELGTPENFEHLLEYEVMLEQLFQTRPLRGICQYRRDLVPATAVRTALLTHRGAYLGNRFAKDNPFYTPPELMPNRKTAISDLSPEGMYHEVLRTLDDEKPRQPPNGNFPVAPEHLSWEWQGNLGHPHPESDSEN
jgi:hypothetical protein